MGEGKSRGMKEKSEDTIRNLEKIKKFIGKNGCFTGR